MKIYELLDDLKAYLREEHRKWSETYEGLSQGWLWVMSPYAKVLDEIENLELYYE